MQYCSKAGKGELMRKFYNKNNDENKENIKYDDFDFSVYLGIWISHIFIF